MNGEKIRLKIDENDKTQADMRLLHRATLSLFADLSLDGVLRRITHAARDLSGAKYAALGIPDENGELKTFITVGMSNEEIQQIPYQPVGKGLIGEILRTGRSIRVASIADHPEASGFPPGHPDMSSFLGVPIIAYGRPLGQIYLTEKEGASSFSASDQRLIEMLASHAAAAIENARLYRQVLSSEAELAQRNEQLQLINDLASGLVSSVELKEFLDDIVDRVIELFDAKSGEIFILEEGADLFKRVELHHAGRKHMWGKNQFRMGEGFLGQVADEGELAWSAELQSDPIYLQEGIAEDGFNTIVAVPLSTRGHVVGVLSLGFIGKRTISDREIGLLKAVGVGVGVGIENARLNRQSRRLAVLEERERIGMDLHDGIIQSIYAVGLTLDSIRAHIEENPKEASMQLQQGIEGLNTAIRDIRSYILDLQPTRFQDTDVSQNLLRLSTEFKKNSQMDIDLHIEEDALGMLEKEQEKTVLHIAQEALANTARHSDATRVLLSVRSTDDHVLLQVIDNGKGFEVDNQPEVLGHGLSNMAQRALHSGGEFEIVSSPDDGTTVTVRMQVSQGQESK
jgi:signal transduction histidine kinase